MEGQLFGSFIFILFIIILIFLICRELIMWYWKVNARLKELQEANVLLKKILEEVRKANRNLEKKYDDLLKKVTEIQEQNSGSENGSPATVAVLAETSASAASAASAPAPETESSDPSPDWEEESEEETDEESGKKNEGHSIDLSKERPDIYGMYY